MKLVTCQRCRQDFPTKAANALYCAPCREENRKERNRPTQAAYMRRKRAEERQERLRQAQKACFSEVLPCGYPALLQEISRAPYAGEDFAQKGGAKRGIVVCACGRKVGIPQVCQWCGKSYCHKCAAYRHTDCQG